MLDSGCWREDSGRVKACLLSGLSAPCTEGMLPLIACIVTTVAPDVCMYCLDHGACLPHTQRHRCTSACSMVCRISKAMIAHVDAHSAHSYKGLITSWTAAVHTAAAATASSTALDQAAPRTWWHGQAAMFSPSAPQAIQSSCSRHHVRHSTRALVPVLVHLAGQPHPLAGTCSQSQV